MVNASRNLPRVLLAVNVILLSACDRSDSNSPAVTPSAATTPTPSAPPTDKSLLASDYIALGIASYDRRWLGQDMATAATKLQTLASKTPDRLPRFGSSRSGPVFDRIVARDNLDFFRSRSLPLASRFPDGIQYFQSLSTIVKIYLSAQASHDVSGDELIELSGAGMRMAEVMLQLTDEFVPTLAKDDPKYPVRMAGLDQMRQGLAGMVAGNLTTLTEEQFYTVSARSKLLAYCRETFPNVVPKLSKPSQQEVAQRLNELVDHPGVRDFRPQVVLLRDEVRAAMNGTTLPSAP